MPVHKILVDEYECIRCGYKWINRINGKDGRRPRRCGKCKREGWDEGPISDREKQLRRKLGWLESVKVTDYSTRRLVHSPSWRNLLLSRSEQSEIVQPGRRPNDLCWVFLWKIKPRPSIKELELVLAQTSQYTRHDLMRNIVEVRMKNNQSQVSEEKKDGANDNRRREKYLRNRLRSLEASYAGISTTGKSKGHPNELCKKFLYGIKPRPTTEELEKTNYPLGIDTQRQVGFIPPDAESLSLTKMDLDEPTLRQIIMKHWNEGYAIHDMIQWRKMCEEESEKRREFMQQIIDSRKKTTDVR